MTKKAKKNGVVIMTLISALLFCSVVVATSLSPLSDLGPNANKFGSLGMWSAIGTVLAFYILPLIVYMLGVDAMRYVMGVLCGFGLLINLSQIVVILVLGVFAENIIPSLLGVTCVCVATVIVSIIWYFVAFRSPSKLDDQKQSF